MCRVKYFYFSMLSFDQLCAIHGNNINTRFCSDRIFHLR
jgi:hypothetical protein